LKTRTDNTEMTIKVTGKNIDLGENLREYALNRVDTALDKYSGRSLSGQISVEKNHDGFFTHCAIHLESGLDVQSTGSGADAYGSVDSATDRLEKRLRRYKRRLKSHGQGVDGSAQLYESAGIDYVIDAEQAADAESGEGGPAVIAETPARVRAMSVSDAVMQMDLADQAFLVFRNAAHGAINVVYRRPDGNIGWIDPSGIVADAKP
jgi:ribosomal subunit interface protein